MHYSLELELEKRNSCCGCPLGYKNASVWYLQQKHVEKITEERDKKLITY